MPKPRESRYGRKSASQFDRQKGKKRHHRSLEERLRKYEVRGEGYEFVPALMHLIRRYAADLPKESKNDLDRRLARALDTLPDAKPLLARALKAHEALPHELRRRVFSPKYLDLDMERSIDAAEMGQIVGRARALRNLSVREIAASAVAVAVLQAEQQEARCCCCCTGTPPGGSQPTPTKPPNKYELTFAKLYCVDESDPEWLGSDEPYVVFGTITEEMAEAGTAAVAVHTPVYQDVDDGDTRPTSGDENLRLFGFTGPRSIDSSVLVAATCFENDLGNPEDTTKAIRTALTTVATTAASAGGVAGWIVAGVAVVGIGVTYLVDLIGADDQIGGTLAISLTEADADARTASVNPVMLDPLHFDGGDSDGIYDAYLKLRRA
jgi:hypothetical protein